MRVQFFLIKNNDENKQPAYSVPLNYKERTERQLQTQLSLLESYVKDAAQITVDVLPVVLCGEDFFQGGNLCSDHEAREGVGQCFHRETAFNFIAIDLANLSQMYPTVLIIPGSMYVSVSGP